MTEDQEQWNARVQADQDSLFRLRHGKIVKPKPKPGSLHPFKRAAKMYTEIVNLRASRQHDLFALRLALGEFPPHVSRGHGGRHRTRNRTIAGILRRHEPKLYPNPGRSEAARRVFHRMYPHQRAAIRQIENEVRAEAWI